MEHKTFTCMMCGLVSTEESLFNAVELKEVFGILESPHTMWRCKDHENCAKRMGISHPNAHRIEGNSEEKPKDELIVSPFYENRRRYKGLGELAEDIASRMPISDMVHGSCAALKRTNPKHGVLVAFEIHGKTPEEAHNIVMEFDGFSKQALERLAKLITGALNDENLWKK